ncbi:MAG: sigma-54 dependent transcriptional regulator [Ignavibacteriae bacterium]|nr:sigma-54 dependent transcriptional regulator [Ignavibacteriota bacterium]
MKQKLVFIVEDEQSLQALMEHWITRTWEYKSRVFTQGEECLEHLDEHPDIVLLDMMLPGISGAETLKAIKEQHPEIPVIILSAQASIQVALETLKLGAIDYFSKPVEFPKLKIAIENALQLNELTKQVQLLRENLEKQVHFDNIIADSSEMREVFRLVNKVKDSDIAVTVLGESGTGKELIARAIHFNGNRKTGPFVVVNCASIPHDLLESELFGHEKGSFTGAHQRRIGKFEQANGGTIFLDEIGELDLTLQAKLLRVIQQKQFDRVGGTETITTDARIVTATNRDLRQQVADKLFREDLYFRLSTFPILLPPMRQRRSDILLLAEHFLKVFAESHGKKGLGFSRKVLKLLYEYPWPGNVRELENSIQRAVVLTDGNEIRETDLPLAIQAYAEDPAKAQVDAVLFEDGTAIVPFEKMKEQAIKHALKITEGNIAEAALRLKIGRATLYRLMQKYKIKG